jgi:hypothetical protein
MTTYRTASRESTGRYDVATVTPGGGIDRPDTANSSNGERRVATSRTTGDVIVRTVPAAPSRPDETSTT